MTFHTIEWLPQHLADMKTWQEICKAYDYLLSKTMDHVGEVYANIFLDSLTEVGCLIWEKLLGITVSDGETVEERKQAIKSYFAGDLPYTENKLRETLKSLAGADTVTLTVSQSIYEIKIDLTINTPAIVSNVQDIVYKMRPCNMIVRICIHYEDQNTVYVGHAVKEIKTITPTTKQGGDPISDLIWLADTDGALLVDDTGGALVI